MNSAPLKRTVLITNPNGMHIRPSAAFVELAGRFESTVNVITDDGRTLNGKSMWDLLLLGESGLPGSELILEAAGPDASQALDALVTLLATPPPADPSGASSP
jgi:phosphotransferase system HPr (HPr) family protein